MAISTREQLLDTAEALFAERGFYGVSIAAIASELGLTKQALLHHFGSKAKLYGEVLKRISDRFEAIAEQTEAGNDDPAERLKSYLLRLNSQVLAHPDQTRLLMRELLDNNQRSDKASVWYLKTFLNRLVAMLRAIPNWQDASHAEALAFIYQLVGTANYYGISEPTLTGIFGTDAYGELDQAFSAQLERLMLAGLEARK